MKGKMPPEKVVESKVLGQYPHYFSIPIFYTKHNRRINSGTISLLAGKEDYFIGLTCWHIIEDFLIKSKEDSEIKFYVGSLEINPIQLLIAHDKELDLATLKLSKGCQNLLKAKSFPSIGSQRVNEIYQEEVQEGDVVTLGGLPGEWVNKLTFETFSIVNCKVHSASASSFSCTVEDSNNWPTVQDQAYPQRKAKDLLKPGGLSGGPVFIETKTEGGIVTYPLAGIIYEGNYIMNSPTLVLSIRPAKFVKLNGEIVRDFATSCNLNLQKGANAIEGIQEN